MPPKKKKGKKKKKKDGEMTIEDRHRKAVEEVEILKDRLALRKEVSRRSQSAAEEWQSKMADMNELLVDQEGSQRAVSSEMTRQYKTMQTELSLRTQQLETELQRTSLKLEQTEAELKQTQEEKEELCKQKDLEINRLKTNIENLGDQFIDIVVKNMERMKDLLDEKAMGQWADRAQVTQAHNKHTLLEFGLKPLNI